MKAFATAFLFFTSLLGLSAEPVTRSEALSIAQRYASHRWEASEKNILHGLDRSKIPVRTPNRPADAPSPDEGLWTVGAVNIGVPYKWGGFDTLESFDKGISSGKAAGDLYTLEKRRKGGAAVSPYAVGIDCSGFISRCWKLPKKQSTSTLPSICRPLASPSELLPGDILNTTNGHVLLFAKWLDDEKSRALFYEAEPFSKVITSERKIAEMINAGYKAFRYRQIRE
ncbi:MAG: hypothetical protein EOP84_22620 [Verrucomicrobiaceae bacterium]|nr:MAG: hypothetical protein EOP84_22620 [Verrucomicrobiaceae bacterium]